MAQLGFFIRTERCVQCHACEVACKSWNGIEPGVRWRRVLQDWGGAYPEVANRTLSIACMHCAKPACAEVCPAGAISKRAEDGVVIVDRNRCIGCRSCSQACPYGIPQYGKSGTMQKCDLCLERRMQGKEPACVATCPGEALRAGTVEELERMAAERSGARLGGDTLPALYISGEPAGGRSWLSVIQSRESAR